MTTMNTKTEATQDHTPGAIRAAEAITGGKYELPHTTGKPMKLYNTSYGRKSVYGIADLIDRETAAPELLEALRYLLNTDNVATVHAKWGEGCNREEVDAMLKRARAAIAKATGKE
jgi:hypothetical protein